MRYVFLILALAFASNSFAYWGQSDSVNVTMTGCNAVSNFQIPGQINLFIGRASFDPTGHPIASNCSTPASQEALAARRQGLVLNQMDWTTHVFSIVKPLLATQQSALTGGPLKGYTVRSAYDPSIALFNGQYWVSFECIIENTSFGTSSCLAAFNNTTQTIDPASIHVVVGQTKTSSTTHTGAAVPALLVYGGNLYMYWSAVTNQNGTFIRIGIRAAQLQADANGYYWLKGANGKVAHSLDPTSVEVWSPVVGDPLSDTAADLKALWSNSSGIIAVASLGGSGCAKSGPLPGCWRMGIGRAAGPLMSFNSGPLLDAPLLPTNGQDYTRPMQLATGGYGLMGVFFAPANNGFSNLRPVPPNWPGGNSNYASFGFQDPTLWPGASVVSVVPDPPGSLQVTP
jgi:hypothetical protein